MTTRCSTAICTHNNAILCWTVLITLMLVTSPTRAVDVFTDFEFNAAAPFSVGTAPESADFSDGVVETRGRPELYTSGFFSWHIGTGETATVTFVTFASALEFFTRTAAAGVVSQIRVFDQNNIEILSQAPTNMFQAVSVVRAAGETLIGSFEVSVTSGGDVVADDMSFTVDAAAAPPPFDPNNPIPAAIATGSVEVLAIDLDSGDTSVFLDVSNLLVPLGAFGSDSFDERGLLGLAFHPDYSANGLLYTYTLEPVGAVADYSTIPGGSVPSHQSVIREFTTPDPMDSASAPDASASRILLRLDEPQFNHNAGALVFDSAGNLLISVGDGGNADDMGTGHGTGNGQDSSNPFGAILRIDPLGNNAINGQYGIPASNPFAGGVGGISEIFAYGFRNPFRMSIDRDSGDLYVADVGQNHIEEVDIVTLGGNYGWNLKEGSFFFDPNGNAAGFVTDVDPGVPAGLIDPIAEYDHDEGIAIIGGFVYRGTAIAALQGRYIFGDFGSFSADAGRVFYLDANLQIRAFDIPPDGTLPLAVNGFAEDADGEIYVLANETGTPFGNTGVVLRIDPVPLPPPPPAANPAPITSSGGGGSLGVLSLLGLVSWAWWRRGRTGARA